MAVLRGQYYQSKILPDQFYFVSRIFSPIKILLFEYPDGFQIYQTTAQIEANYTLLDSLPQNRLKFTGGGSAGVSVAYGLTDAFLSARVESHNLLHAKAFAPTRLRARLTAHGKVFHAGLINPLILGGHLAAQGTVLQAQANNG